MAHAISTALSNRFLNWLCRGTAYTPPAVPYACLWIGAPTDDGTGGNQVTSVGTAYVPQGATFNAPASGTKHVHHEGLISFPTATAEYGGTIDHLALRTAASGGELLWWGPLSNTKTIAAGQTFTFPDDRISITLSGNLSDYAIECLLNMALRGQTITAPTARKGALWIGDPTPTGLGGAEIAGVDYARTAITFGTDAAAQAIANTAKVTFPAAGAGGWSTVGYSAVWDTAGTPHMLGSGAVESQLISETDVYEFAIGAITLTLT